MTNNQYRSHHGDMSGSIAIKLANNQSFNDFCVEHIPNYNRDRFEAFAIRILIGKETIITVYALDKTPPKNPPEKIPVRKFKLNISPLDSLFSYCESLNLTLTTGTYKIDDIEIMNK